MRHPKSTESRRRGPVRRILLAEDDPNDRELILAVLAENRLINGVDVVRNGAEALDYLFYEGEYAARAPLDPVLVLLDLKMPKVDGLEVLRHIRADARLCSLPVVLLTSSREERDVVEGYRLAVNAYVVKPVAFENLVEVVRVLGLFWAVVNEPPPSRSAGRAA